MFFVLFLGLSSDKIHRDNISSNGTVIGYIIEDKDILPPISRPKQNIMCMGLNYEDHIKESEKVF